MRLIVTTPDSELGRVINRRRGDEGEGAVVVINTTLQVPNTLLHDGHAWWRNPGQHIVDTTARVLAAAERDHAAFLVHASFAFLDAAGGGRQGDRVMPIVEAAKAAERMVLGGVTPACVVRLGYLYGPDWQDLRAYRRAFALRRLYWAGPHTTLQHHLFADDAADALVTAAERRGHGDTAYATDGTPASFADFMDHFAHLIGRHPRHIPAGARRLVHPFVREVQMQMLEMSVAGPGLPRLAGWEARVRDFRVGLAEVVTTWGVPR